MWIADNHVPMPKAGEPQRTLMEERALREEAQRAVSQPIIASDWHDKSDNADHLLGGGSTITSGIRKESTRCGRAEPTPESKDPTRQRPQEGTERESSTSRARTAPKTSPRGSGRW